MHWDESKADPNDNGGSVLDAGTGKVIPGAGRQSGSTGPGGNGVTGSQANPNGNYHAGPPVGGGVFGSGGFTGGTSGVAPLGKPGDFSATPFASWLLKQQGAAPVTGYADPSAQPATDANPFGGDPTGWAQFQARQRADQLQQQIAHDMNTQRMNDPRMGAFSTPWTQSGYGVQ